MGPNADFSETRPSTDNVEPIMIFLNFTLGSTSSQRASSFVNNGNQNIITRHKRRVRTHDIRPIRGHGYVVRNVRSLRNVILTISCGDSSCCGKDTSACNK